MGPPQQPKNKPTMLSTKTCLALALCMACVFAAPRSDETSAVYTDGKAKMALAGCTYPRVANEADCKQLCLDNDECHRWSFTFSWKRKGECSLKGYMADESGCVRCNGEWNGRVNSGGIEKGFWFEKKLYEFLDADLNC